MEMVKSATPHIVPTPWARYSRRSRERHQYTLHRRPRLDHIIDQRPHASRRHAAPVKSGSYIHLPFFGIQLSLLPHIMSACDQYTGQLFQKREWQKEIHSLTLKIDHFAHYKRSDIPSTNSSEIANRRLVKPLATNGTFL